MALILAIEPDQRQAAQLTEVIGRRVSAELVLAESTERALAAIGDRVPDLVLIPMLLSPQEDAALAGALRMIATAGRVQMLTIPVLADGPKPVRKRGVLAKLRSRPASPTPDGCDPAVFGDQIAAYLAAAALARDAAAGTDVQHIDPPVDVVAAAPVEQIAAPPIDVAALTPVEHVDAAPIEDVVVAAVEVAPPDEGVAAAVEAVAEEPWLPPVAAPAPEALPSPIEQALAPVEESIWIPVVIPIDEPEVGTIEESIAMPIAEMIAESIDEPIQPPVEDFTHVATEAATVASIDEPLAVPAEEPIYSSVTASISPPAVIVADEPLTFPVDYSIAVSRNEPIAIPIDDKAAVEFDEPAVYELSLDEWTGDAASMMAINAMMLPAGAAHVASAITVDQPDAEPPIDVMETSAAMVEPVAVVVEPIALAAEPPVAVFAEPVMLVVEDPVAVVVDPAAPALEEPVAIVEPAAPVAQPLAAAAAPAPAPAPALVTPVAPVAPAALFPPVPPAAPAVVGIAAVEDDPGFFGAGAEAAFATPAPKPRRHEWIELVESLRLDLERRRVEREANEGAAPEEPTRVVAPPIAMNRRTVAQPAKKVARAKPARPKTRKNEPIQNEWGLFDPEQCGFAALLAKLDEITHAK